MLTALLLDRQDIRWAIGAVFVSWALLGIGCAPKQTIPRTIHTRDGATMALIPAGPTTERFYLDVTEVTIEQYRRFVDATGHPVPRDFEIGHESRAIWENPHLRDGQMPIVGVSWEDARAYASWAGKRLPTEEEWEFAARGGRRGALYPWGDDPPTPDRVNIGQKQDRGVYVFPVRSFPPNGYGLYEMAGNAAEWCDATDDTGRWRLLKGGGWTPTVDDVRITARYPRDATARDIAYGFRTALDVAAIRRDEDDPLSVMP